MLEQSSTTDASKLDLGLFLHHRLRSDRFVGGVTKDMRELILKGDEGTLHFLSFLLTIIFFATEIILDLINAKHTVDSSVTIQLIKAEIEAANALKAVMEQSPKDDATETGIATGSGYINQAAAIVADVEPLKAFLLNLKIVTDVVDRIAEVRQLIDWCLEWG